MKRFSAAYLLKEGVRSFWKQRVMSTASIMVLIVSMVLVSSLVLVFFNVDSTLSLMEEQNVIMAFLDDELDETAKTEAGEKIASIKNVKQCDFVSREEAWKQQIESFGDDASVLLEGITESPLPDAYKIVLEDMSIFKTTIEEIKAVSGVMSVRENSQLASQLTRIRSIVSTISIGAFILFSLISICVTTTTLSLVMSGCKLEISMMKSFGATNAFIRTPFIVQGALYGVVSAAVSFGLMYGIYSLLLNVVGTVSFSLNSSILPFKNFAIPMILLFLAYGVLVGVCGSWISMRKYLNRGSGIYGDD